MDRLEERLKTAAQALRTLVEIQAMDIQPEVKRDAAILRFTYTFEAIWKTAQRYLAEIEGVELASPKPCIRACRDAGLLSDDEAAAALVMADHRNLSVHLYNEGLADQLRRRLPAHTALLTGWLRAMQRRGRGGAN